MPACRGPPTAPAPCQHVEVRRGGAAGCDTCRSEFDDVHHERGDHHERRARSVAPAGVTYVLTRLVHRASPRSVCGRFAASLANHSRTIRSIGDLGQKSRSYVSIRAVFAPSFGMDSGSIPVRFASGFAPQKKFRRCSSSRTRDANSSRILRERDLAGRRREFRPIDQAWPFSKTWARAVSVTRSTGSAQSRSPATRGGGRSGSGGGRHDRRRAASARRPSPASCQRTRLRASIDPG